MYNKNYLFIKNFKINLKKNKFYYNYCKNK